LQIVELFQRRHRERQAREAAEARALHDSAPPQP
jgi:hypothetical protein